MHRFNFLFKLYQINLVIAVCIQDLKNDTQTSVLLPYVVFKLLLTTLELILVDIERNRLINS